MHSSEIHQQLEQTRQAEVICEQILPCLGDSAVLAMVAQHLLAECEQRMQSGASELSTFHALCLSRLADTAHSFQGEHKRTL